MHSPFLTAARAYLKDMIMLAAELGFTPSARARLGAQQRYQRPVLTIELVIERQGDELRIRPARRRMGDVQGKLAKFSPDFMSESRGLNVEGEREAL